MKSKDNEFGLVLNNIPLINLRSEFNSYLQLLRNDDFCKQFYKGKSIQTPLLIWLGMPADLLTLLLQRTILGLESYIFGAVFLEAGKRGLYTKEISKKMRNPLKFGGKGMADNLYNKIPEIIDKQFSLKNYNLELWEKAKKFYKEIRNPIFHGYQLDTYHPKAVLPVLQFVREIYRWIDSWHSPEDLLPEIGQLSNI